jgi:DNA repair exonuclease SbcCD ATPase subunit
VSADPFPIRLLALVAESFRGLGVEHALDLDSDLTVLVGRNGAGKSSLLVAIEWCLFGAEATRKTGSGIAERADWALAHEGVRGDVRVTLELAVERGRARLTRRRAAAAKPRDDDAVELELPGEPVLRGAEVRDWLDDHGMPDWMLWRRSFCQHQELSRDRVTDEAGRSTAIAAMLGLDDYRSAGEALKKLKARRLEQRAADELRELADDERRALERPGLELRDLESRLERLGVAATRAGDAELDRRTEALCDDARTIAAGLGLDDARIPEHAAGTAEVIAWASGWRDQVRRRIDAISKESTALATRVQTLKSSADALEPARRAEADARRVRERLAAELGSIDGLHAERDEQARRRAALDDERRRRDAVGRLLEDALQIVRHAAAPDSCPVCDRETSGLDRVIRTKLDAHATDELESRYEAIDARDAKLEAQIDELQSAERSYDAARRQVEYLEQQVRGQLPAGAADGAPIDELTRAWDGDLRALRDASDRAEQYLSALSGELEILGLLVRLRDARARASAAVGDITQTPEFEALDRAIDDAAGFASDLEALAAMARELEDEKSDERIGAVNESLDAYFTTITGQSGRGCLRVEPKRTATKVSYRLVDGHGRAVTSIMNQAAFNALSLATLLASAESRARRGLPQFLVLDDPGQSLDDQHEAGLAQAIARFASIAPVIVATYPGTLADALANAGVERARTFLLARSGDGARTTITETRP